MYDSIIGAFTTLDIAKLEICASQPIPDNCPVCPLHAEREAKTNIQELKDDNGVKNGVAFGGHTYHYEDFVLYRADKGPANIGYITEFDLNGKAQMVTIRKVGRISSLDHILPKHILRDEVCYLICLLSLC